MATPGQLQMYNKLEPDELFSLGQDSYDKRVNKMHRIHMYPDEKVPDACLFKVFLEDHTMGNALRMELLRNEDVIFAAYRVPHPYNHMIEIRVQTTAKSSCELAMRRAIRNLRAECSSMLDQFDRGVALLQGRSVTPAVGGTPAKGALGDETASDSSQNRGADTEGLQSTDSAREEQLLEWERGAQHDPPTYTRTGGSSQPPAARRIGYAPTSPANEDSSD